MQGLISAFYSNLEIAIVICVLLAIVVKPCSRGIGWNAPRHLSKIIKSSLSFHISFFPYYLFEGC